ncbi:MAG TPA: FG-GAP repeat protein, partial [Desulfomonilia bacterium]|nr:FG-GAP repeat protein [Desulfomonilia bacterium]
TLAVGGPGEASNATGVNAPDGQLNGDAAYSGAVYVFTRTGDTWTQQAYIKASNTDENDLFGYSVALSGDTLAVGGPGEASNATGVNAPDGQSDDSALESGAAYILR